MHRTRIRQELLQNAVHAPSITAPLRGLLALDRVELLKNLDGNRQVIVLEFVDRLGIVQQYVRVQNVGFRSYLNRMLR